MGDTLKYQKLSKELQARIIADSNGALSADDYAVRRDASHDKANLWRPSFVRDVEKILHCSYYNRYADKTQVFSFYKNDDISHRAFHVQLVSRIARNIGRMLGLNLDLIEAIALGHDIGHTPFGHAGERFLNELYHERTGRFFNHNVHSVRVLDKILNLNLSLQTLDGILCHNGEFECKEYRPEPLSGFEEFDKKIEECYIDSSAIGRLVPSTLEGCVVRVCDMIAYIGKDRQDAVRTHTINSEDIFGENAIGRVNAQIINNMIVNIIENSYGRDYIRLDGEHYESLRQSKADNYRLIYHNDELAKKYDEIIKPMFGRIYERILADLASKNKSSPVFVHHIEHIKHETRFRRGADYRETEPNQIAVDYIASMTDDYFIDLYEYLFNEPSGVEYISYFNGLGSA